MYYGICKWYWGSVFAHGIFNVFFGPCIALLLVFLFRKKMSPRYWLKSVTVYLLANFTSCGLVISSENACETRLYGPLVDNSEVVGSTSAISLPEFLVFTPAFLLLFFLGFWLLKLMKARS